MQRFRLKGRRHYLQQRGEIHGQAFGQRGGSDAATVECTQPLRI